MNLGKSEAVNQRQRFRDILVETNSHTMDAELLDLPSNFADFLEVYTSTALGNFCPYYSNLASEQAGMYNFWKLILKLKNSM